MKKKKLKSKELEYYLQLPWTYNIERETHKDSSYYVIRVNEKGEPIPEPIDREHFKGKIAYRTDSMRHYLIAKTAERMHKSISKTMDSLIDTGLNHFRY